MIQLVSFIPPSPLLLFSFSLLPHCCFSSSFSSSTSSSAFFFFPSSYSLGNKFYVLWWWHCIVTHHKPFHSQNNTVKHMVCQNFLIAIGSFKLPTLARLCRDLVVLETQQTEETRLKRAAQATYRDSILKNQNDFETFHCYLVTSLLPQPLTVLSPLWPSGPLWCSSQAHWGGRGRLASTK